MEMVQPDQQIVNDGDPQGDTKCFDQSAHPQLRQPMAAAYLGIHTLARRRSEFVRRFRFFRGHAFPPCGDTL